MKRIFLTAMAALAASGLFAATVTPDRAKATATAFMKQMTGRQATVSEVVSQTDTYFIMNMTGGGWVIVSADDTATPVLGYNTRGSLSWHKLPDTMRGMLGDYSREIKSGLNAGLKAQNVEWRRLSLPASRSRAAVGEVPPLISVNWDQTPPFNHYCPGEGKQKALVGCVAVAMSQAMSVQQYPAQPQGFMTYACAGYGQITVDYDAEKAYKWNEILSGANGSAEVARLLFHAGVSVMMGYGVEGSGVPSNEVFRIPNALAATFGYNADDLTYIWRDGYKGDWASLVLNELNAGRAVVYNAVDDKGHYGHSFNVDGYDGHSMFHLNWGWGGYGDGYFTLDNLSDKQMGMNYNSGHVVVLGIGSPNQVLRSISLTDEVIDEQMPAGTVLGQILVNGEEPESTFSLELYGAYNAATQSYAELPFELSGNLVVTKKPLAASADPIELNVRVVDSASKTRLVSSFMITVCKRRTIAQATSMSFDRATKELTIKTRNGMNYTLTGKNGATLKQGVLSPLPHLVLNLADLDEGENKLVLSEGSDSKTLVIKK